MTANQSTALAKNPNTKKAIAVLQKFAKKEAEFKALEKESKAAAELIKQAMIDQGITKIDIDLPTVTGYITLAERISYKAEDIDFVEMLDEVLAQLGSTDSDTTELIEQLMFVKLALDTDKVKASAVLTGQLPTGIAESKTQYITKKFKAVA